MDKDTAVEDTEGAGDTIVVTRGHDPWLGAGAGHRGRGTLDAASAPAPGRRRRWSRAPGCPRRAAAMTAADPPLPVASACGGAGSGRGRTRSACVLFLSLP